MTRLEDDFNYYEFASLNYNNPQLFAFDAYCARMDLAIVCNYIFGELEIVPYKGNFLHNKHHVTDEELYHLIYGPILYWNPVKVINNRIYQTPFIQMKEFIKLLKEYLYEYDQPGYQKMCEMSDEEIEERILSKDFTEVVIRKCRRYFTLPNGAFCPESVNDMDGRYGYGWDDLLLKIGCLVE